MNFLIILVSCIMLVPVELSAQQERISRLTWKKAGELPASAGQLQPLGFAGPVASIHNNVLLFGGGANFPDGLPWEGGKKKYYDDVYVYTKSNDTLLRKKFTSKLPSPIAYAAVCTLPQGIVYAGGENDNGISNKVYLLGWDATTEKIITAQLPHLPVALTNAGGTSHNNVIYIAGGETVSGVSDKFYCLDLNNTTAGWRQLPPLPAPVSHMLMLGLGKGEKAAVYVFGGRKKNNDSLSALYNTVYAFSIASHKWTQKKSLPYALMAGTGISVDAENILLFGGDRGESFHQSEALAMAIAHTNDTALQQQLLLQKNKLQSAHPGFSKTMLLYNTQKNEWHNAGEMSYPAQVTTAAIQWNDMIIIPGGEIRAGVRTPLIVAATFNAPGK